jgi:surface antigen
MKCRPVAAVAFLLAATLAPAASAQALVNPFGRDATSLDREDIALMHQAIEKVLASNKPGTKESWKNARGGHAGRATLLKVFKQKNMACGEVEHVFTAGGGRRYVLPFCKTAEGQWKLAF